MLVIAALAFTSVPVTASAAPKVRLWVDAGHGGKDPGAMAGGIREKDSNLVIARMVAAQARRRGWVVRTTRQGDYFVPLATRTRRANDWGADVFVSIHSNSMGKRPRGYMTIYRTKAGARLGADIMSELDPMTDYADIGNRSDYRGLAVLRRAQAPAVIVELLSVSSPQERKVLTTRAEQRKMARAIVRGIARNRSALTTREREAVKRKAARKKAEARQATEFERIARAQMAEAEAIAAEKAAQRELIAAAWRSAPPGYWDRPVRPAAEPAAEPEPVPEPALSPALEATASATTSAAVEASAAAGSVATTATSAPWPSMPDAQSAPPAPSVDTTALVAEAWRSAPTGFWTERGSPSGTPHAGPEQR